MALIAGTVTVDEDGNASGAGMARAIYDGLSGAPWDTPAELIPLLYSQFAIIANAIAAGVVAHVVANAAVTITIGTGDAGLQRMPASTAEDTPTKAPSSPKTLTGSIA